MLTDYTLGCLKIDDINFGMVHERSRAGEVEGKSGWVNYLLLDSLKRRGLGPPFFR